MNIDELNRKIESSALAERPLWFTFLCGFVGISSLLGGLLIIGLLCFKHSLVMQNLSAPSALYTVAMCALYAFGARRLWLYHWSSIAIWAVALVLIVSLEFGLGLGLNPGTLSIKPLFIPAVMLGLSLLKSRPS